MSTASAGRRVLGLGCGQPHGSAEILLKAALRAAEEEGADVGLVRLDELRLPSGAAEGTEPDDAWWLWERLVEADGLIVSTPIMSRTVAARLKLLGDRLLGPNADAAIIEGLLALRAQGREPVVPFRVDERGLKETEATIGGSTLTKVLDVRDAQAQNARLQLVTFEVVGGRGDEVVVRIEAKGRNRGDEPLETAGRFVKLGRALVSHDCRALPPALGGRSVFPVPV